MHRGVAVRRVRFCLRGCPSGALLRSSSAGGSDRRFREQQAVQELHDLVVNLVGPEPVSGVIPAGDRGERAVEQVDRNGNVDVGADESLIDSLPEKFRRGVVHLSCPGLIVAQALW
jgi:hypothetical protein